MIKEIALAAVVAGGLNLAVMPPAQAQPCVNSRGAFGSITWDVGTCGGLHANIGFPDLDAILCPILASLAPGVPGVLDIDAEGDVAIAGIPFWDCPPYGS
jgi:hypothetical protein